MESVLTQRILGASACECYYVKHAPVLMHSRAVWSARFTQALRSTGVYFPALRTEEAASICAPLGLAVIIRKTQLDSSMNLPN